MILIFGIWEMGWIQLRIIKAVQQMDVWIVFRLVKASLLKI